MTNPINPVALLACPFCGGEAAVQQYRPRSWGAGCINDECQWLCTAEAYAPSRKKAVEIWNTRSAPRLARRVIELEEALEHVRRLALLNSDGADWSEKIIETCAFALTIQGEAK